MNVVCCGAEKTSVLRDSAAEKRCHLRFQLLANNDETNSQYALGFHTDISAGVDTVVVSA